MPFIVSKMSLNFYWMIWHHIPGSMVYTENIQQEELNSHFSACPVAVMINLLQLPTLKFKP
jgi:hypothetical protein